MEKIRYKLKRTTGSGLLHDSRQDVRSLIVVCNDLIDLTDELVDEINSLKSQIKEMERK